jgi:hypothetical protein
MRIATSALTLFLACAVWFWNGEIARGEQISGTQVLDGRAAVSGTTKPLARGAALPSGTAITVQTILSVRMPDGTRAQLFPHSKATFGGVDAKRTLSVRLQSGEIMLDTSSRNPGTAPLLFDLRTPLHTVVTFRSVKGVLIVEGTHDRVACEQCPEGDLVVRSFEKQLMLSLPGQVAVVTPDGGLLGGVLGQAPFHFDAATVNNGWILRSATVAVRPHGGDVVKIADYCPGAKAELRIVGGIPPFTATAADPRTATAEHTAAARTFTVHVNGTTRLLISDPQRDTAVLNVATNAARCSATAQPGPR